jgi:hypothetical protein
MINVTKAKSGKRDSVSQKVDSTIFAMIDGVEGFSDRTVASLTNTNRRSMLNIGRAKSEARPGVLLRQVLGSAPVSGTHGKKLNPRVNHSILKYLQDNSREDADGKRYLSSSVKSMWACFVAHVDAEGVYHRAGVLGEGNSVSYDTFRLRVPSDYVQETWETCCCQHCYEVTQLVERHLALINLAHDPNSLAELGRNIKVECLDPECPARCLAGKLVVRDVLTDQVASKMRTVPYLFCAHETVFPKSSCSRGDCKDCGWEQRIPVCSALADHTNLRWSEIVCG